MLLQMESVLRTFLYIIAPNVLHTQFIPYNSACFNIDNI